MWTEFEREDKTVVYNFKTDNVSASLYEIKNSKPNDKGETQWHFYATTKISNRQIDGYFNAKDVNHAKDVMQTALYQNLLPYRVIVDRVLTEIRDCMGGDIECG